MNELMTKLLEDFEETNGENPIIEDAIAELRRGHILTTQMASRVMTEIDAVRIEDAKDSRDAVRMGHKLKKMRDTFKEASK